MLGICMALIDDEEDKLRFEKLFKQYSQEMFRIAYGILNNTSDAEDAVSQTFLQIARKFTKISSFDSKELHAYIVIIIRNTSLNIYKQNKRKAQTIIQSEDIEIVDNSFFETIDYKLLVDSIKLLPQDYKDIIYLYHIQNLSAKEIAKMLNTSENNIYQKVLRAKHKLKQILNRDDNNDSRKFKGQ